MELLLNLFFPNLTAMKRLLLLPLLLSAWFAGGCGNTDPVEAPTHLSRVPRPYGLTAIKDTTATGKARIKITWQVSSAANIKSYDVFKGTGKPVIFRPAPPAVSTAAFTDSMDFAADTITVYYYVLPTGLDRFIGQASDTLLVKVKK